MNKALRAVVSGGAVILGILSATAGARADEAGDRALAALDEATNRAKSYYFEFDVANRDGTKLALIVRLKGDKRLTEFTAPADMKGTKVLILSTTQTYVYLPAFGKVRRVASSVSDQGFMGMTFSPDDFITIFSPQYTATIAADSPAEMKLVAVAKAGQTPAYAKVEFTIAKDRFLATEVKYFNAAGTNVKTEVRTGYTCEGNICTPSEQTMTDNTKNGVWTKMTRKAWRVNVDLSDDMFSKRALEH
jgi:outer membrane lipoprotein-sorting protein